MVASQLLPELDTHCLSTSTRAGGIDFSNFTHLPCGDVEDESLALPGSNGRNCRDPHLSTTTQQPGSVLGTLRRGQETQFSGLTVIIRLTFAPVGSRQVRQSLCRLLPGLGDWPVCSWLRPQCSKLIQADPAFQNHSAASNTTNGTELSVKLCILLLFTIEN